MGMGLTSLGLLVCLLTEVKLTSLNQTGLGLMYAFLLLSPESKKQVTPLEEGSAYIS